MPDKQFRQNTLPVTTIQRYQGEYGVDLHFILVGGQRNLTTILSTLMNLKRYCGETWNKEYADYFSIVYSMYETKLDLGLEEPLGSIEKTQIKSFFKLLQSKEMWIEPFFVNSRFFMTPFEFFGILGSQYRFPVIKEVRRKSVHHHQSFVGVGYRDKGAAKDVAQNSTPSWADMIGNQEEKIKKTEILRRNVHLEIKDPTVLTVTIVERLSPFEPPKRANFQKVHYGDHLIGYLLRKEPLAEYCGYQRKLSLEDTLHYSELLKTRMSDGELFIL